MSMWMIRAGRGAKFLDDFVDKNIVAIGWKKLGEIAPGMSRAAIMEFAMVTAIVSPHGWGSSGDF